LNGLIDVGGKHFVNILHIPMNEKEALEEFDSMWGSKFIICIRHDKLVMWSGFKPPPMGFFSELGFHFAPT
jgi:hypothetical protein